MVRDERDACGGRGLPRLPRTCTASAPRRRKPTCFAHIARRAMLSGTRATLAVCGSHSWDYRVVAGIRVLGRTAAARMGAVHAHADVTSTASARCRAIPPGRDAKGHLVPESTPRRGDGPRRRRATSSSGRSMPRAPPPSGPRARVRPRPLRRDEAGSNPPGLASARPVAACSSMRRGSSWRTPSGAYRGRAVIVTAGTLLRGLIHVGLRPEARRAASRGRALSTASSTWDSRSGGSSGTPAARPDPRL